MAFNIPIFPLPNVVLLPHTVLPLHIFEPRYKTMFTSVLESSIAQVGVAQLKPGWEGDYYGEPPVYKVIGIGKVKWCEKFEDGRYDLVLEGLSRAKILTEKITDGFRVAEVETMEEYLASEGQEEVEESMRALLPVFRKVITSLPETMEGMQPASWSKPHAGVVADVLAKVFMENAYERQSILSELNIQRRLRLINIHLESLLNPEI